MLTVAAPAPGTFQLRVPHWAGWATPSTTTVGLGNQPSQGLHRVNSKRRVTCESSVTLPAYPLFGSTKAALKLRRRLTRWDRPGPLGAQLAAESTRQ